MNKDLFSSYTLGDITLSNRIVMAPMTRNRAGSGNVPQDLNTEYYRQRASAGLIITEASQVSAEGIGYPSTPGIHNEQQVKGWSKIVSAVHDQGGRIYIQLWYCGRISHPSLLPDKSQPVAPSAIKPEGEAITYEGMQEFITPHALELNEINDITNQYKQAAIHAKTAGFDGIEIHAANGYLIDQFLRDGSNSRTDNYGGTIENRMRFLNQILDAVHEIWSNKQIGIRLSPENGFNSMSDSDPQTHFSYIVKQLNTRQLAYLHILEGDMMSAKREVNYKALRKLYDGTYMANSGYTKDSALSSLNNDESDLVAFGIPFISNPDLVDRFKLESELNDADQSTFYGGNAKGYIDYTTLNAASNSRPSLS